MVTTTEVKNEPLVESIIPIYWGTNKKILKMCVDKLKKQSYKNHKITLADGSGGLAHAFNDSIKKSKAYIVFLWSDDVYPETNDFIRIMVTKLKTAKAEVVTSESFIDNELWESFDLPTRILTEREAQNFKQNLYANPSKRYLSERVGYHVKGSGYLRENFDKYGFFDTETFRNSGEIADLGYRWNKNNLKVTTAPLNTVHYHPETFRGRLRKEMQTGSALGALYRKNFRYHKSLLKAIFPYAILRGIITPTEFKSFKVRFTYAPFINLLANIQYMRGFWKGFLKGKQDVKYK